MKKTWAFLLVLTSFFSFSKEESNWEYHEKTDKLRNSSFYFARNMSINTNDLGFPYEKNKLGITLQKHLNDQNILLEMFDGQFFCSNPTEYDTCPFTIRFDNGEISKEEYIPYRGGGEKAFIFEPESFFKRMKNAHQAIIELQAYRGGTVQYVFDLSGFDVKKSHFE
ncbi:hypothetical protein [Providencia rettgeri]|uniref:hypothetical protein n=1 Tax=Providencia rettgeri TaxID=587 RepID=UPI001EE7445B|nr:hypothetical protein [Providencia rettgeri]MCG5279860.1 hypothetical protein [Providencia rettgeri]